MKRRGPGTVGLVRGPAAALAVFWLACWPSLAGPTAEKNVTALEPGADGAAGSDPAPARLSDESIENVIHFLRFVFDGSNPGAAAEPKAITALLLKDGRVFESEPSAPSAFDPSTRSPGSAGTGRWQRDGEAYALSFSDGTQGTAVAKAAKTIPAPAALPLNGTYVATGGPAGSTLPERLRFFDDGSLLLIAAGAPARTGHYRIAKRTIEIGDGTGAHHAYLFGLQGEIARPDVLIVANRIYEREDLAAPLRPARERPSAPPSATSSIP